MSSVESGDPDSVGCQDGSVKIQIEINDQNGPNQICFSDFI